MNRLAALLLPAVLCAQQTIVSTYDVNGRLVRGHGISRTATDGASSSSHTITNLNGRKVPVQEVEERVISSSPTDSITERTVRRYDANGNPLPLERTRIERKTFQDESEQTITTVTRGDATGRTQISERSTQLIRKLGKDQIVSTMVERPSSTGSLELIEKVDSELRSVGENKTLSSTVVARKDTNGRFREAAKTTSEFHTYEGRTQESIVEYEAAATGTMNFVRQRVIRILQKPGGGSRTEIDFYEPEASGKALTADSKPKLVRQQIIENNPLPGGATEVVSVRMASADNGGKLGPERKVEERSCSGRCGSPN